jgi:hypothetical protein
MTTTQGAGGPGWPPDDVSAESASSVTFGAWSVGARDKLSWSLTRRVEDLSPMAGTNLGGSNRHSWLVNPVGGQAKL